MSLWYHLNTDVIGEFFVEMQGDFFLAQRELAPEFWATTST
jgi:hypothetical protein